MTTEAAFSAVTLSDALSGSSSTRAQASNRSSNDARIEDGDDSGAINEQLAFSYVLASASLIERASVALNTHGATADAPDALQTNAIGARDGSSGNTPGNNGRAPLANNNNPGASGQGDGSSRAAQTNAPSGGSASPRLGPQTAGQTASTSQQQAVNLVAQPTLAPLAPQASAPSAARATGAIGQGAGLSPNARNEAALAQRTAQTGATRPQAPLSTPSTEQFAQLIARRLDQDRSAFTLRLDPPELGRVEGRFEVGGDGRTSLQLRFDNQSAFDLFRQDDASLRAALAEVGVDASETDINFAFSPDGFRDDGWNNAVTPPDHQTSILTIGDDANIPVADVYADIIGVSSGAIDLKV